MSLTALFLMHAACVEYEVSRFDATDVFYQDPPAAVDVLLVVDDSYSMAPYQEELSGHFGELIRFFTEADVDYQIGVVTTSVVDPAPSETHGCSQEDVDQLPDAGVLVDGEVITAATEDPGLRFAELVNVGVCGSGMEMGMEAAWMAVDARVGDGTNAGFLRADASLSVIFVSDEEDSSPWPVHDYVNRFQSLKGDRARDVFNASSLVVLDLATCPREQRELASVGHRYRDIVSETGGVAGDICRDDFSNIVTELSLATSRLLDAFALSRLPDAATLQVTVDGVEVACEEGVWSYDLEADEAGAEQPVVRFDPSHVPPPLSQVAIRYFEGTGDPAASCVVDSDTEVSP